MNELVKKSKKSGNFFYGFLVECRIFLTYWSKLCLANILFGIGFSNVCHILIHFGNLIMKYSYHKING